MDLLVLARRLLQGLVGHKSLVRALVQPVVQTRGSWMVEILLLLLLLARPVVLDQARLWLVLVSVEHVLYLVAVHGRLLQYDRVLALVIVKRRQ